MDTLFTVLGSATTVVAFAAFVGVVAWAYGKRRREAFEQAANLPFALPDDAAGPDNTERRS
jgi:cytochrome c oxidase cbb3-type subunit 4